MKRSLFLNYKNKVYKKPRYTLKEIANELGVKLRAISGMLSAQSRLHQVTPKPICKKVSIHEPVNLYDKDEVIAWWKRLQEPTNPKGE